MDKVEEKKHIRRTDRTQNSPHVRGPLICIRQKNNPGQAMRDVHAYGSNMYYIHLHAEPVSHLFPIKWHVLTAIFAC